MSTKEGNIKWTDEAFLRLAYLVHKHSAHKRTDIKMELKWETIAKELSTLPYFQGNELNWKTLQNTYKRLASETLKLTGVTEQTANLSALPDSASEVQKLIVDMVEENTRSKHMAELANQKKAAVTKGMLHYEATGLEQQGKPFMSSAEKSGGESSDKSSITTSPKNSPAGWLNFRSTLIDLTGEREEMEIELQAKKRKLDQEADMEQIRIQREREDLERTRKLHELAVKERELAIEYQKQQIEVLKMAMSSKKND